MVDRQQMARASEAIRAFVTTPLDALLKHPAERDPSTAALALFHDTVETVPAYRDFLARHSIDPASIRTAADFLTLPLTTKQSYVLAYPLPQLCTGGRIEHCDMVAVSSGSTGQPTFWPRFVTDELPTAVRFEQVFHDSFAADIQSTLAVVCFALGNWVGGMFTAACCRHLAAKGYPITVVTPGSNRDEIFRAVRDLAPHFAQVVLLGYPPFLKDVIDGGRAAGIDWRPLNVKLVMAGEVFSEEWRSLIAERIGASDPCYDFASLYGTADAGVLGNETPLSIAIRRFLSRTPEAARQLFGQSRLPTLVQYDPLVRYFESLEDGTLIFSGRNGVPLVRYHIADSGGIITHEAMLHFLAGWGFDPGDALAGHGWRGDRPLPFLYLFGRSNFAVSYFGANVYPENVSVALEQPGIRDQVTGKFVLQAKEGLEEAPHLAIVVELAADLAPEAVDADAIAGAILDQLLRLNSEFANYTPAEYRRPRVTLRPAGDPEWFPPGVKHRYSRP
ncbi:phenylacetate--CoA ligase family protein [Rhodospirillaceae bacterium SYSU D60014]|uniref:phenylacetate--CoA ligase family protein n=1 Tax=Virgifigura deserti TaxID=2268457 RepID=UPI000E673CD5